jgi:hypothetical protein
MNSNQYLVVGNDPEDPFRSSKWAFTLIEMLGVIAVATMAGSGIAFSVR